MKHYTKMEIASVIIGLGIIAFGIVMVVHPNEMTMTPQGSNRYAILGRDKPVHYSKKGSQIIGGLSVVMGAGVCWLALSPSRKR